MLVVGVPVHAEQYLSQEEFLAQAFSGAEYTKNKLWLTSAIKEKAKEILRHDYAGLRVSYWKSGNATAWIIDEIGKERPITIGVAVRDQQISQVSILEFRESRGWEVRYPFFTEQFEGVQLTDEHTLNKMIDGVTGATLSVRAVKKVAALALYLHSLALEG